MSTWTPSGKGISVWGTTMPFLTIPGITLRSGARFQPSEFTRCLSSLVIVLTQPVLRIHNHGADRSGSIELPRVDPLGAGAAMSGVTPATQLLVAECQVPMTCGVGSHCSGGPILSRCHRDAVRSAGSRSPDTRVV